MWESKARVGQIDAAVRVEISYERFTGSIATVSMEPAVEMRT